MSFTNIFLFQFGFVILGWALCWLCGIYPWGTWSWDFEACKSAALATLPVVVFFFLFKRIRSGEIGRFNRWMDEHIIPIFQNTAVWQLLLISALAGFGEELFFRGWLQTLMAGSFMGNYGALIVASIVFGLCHAMTRIYFLLAAGIGFYLGWLLLSSQNLAQPIIVHGLYDAVALIYLTRIYKRPQPVGTVSQNDSI